MGVRPVALDLVRPLEIRKYAFVVAGGIAERGRGFCEVARGLGRSSPREVQLIVQERDEQLKELRLLLIIIGAPHLELEISDPIGIEHARGAWTRRRPSDGYHRSDDR